MRTVVVCLVLAGVVAGALAAPAPSSKPVVKKPAVAVPAVVGTWQLTWGFGKGEVVLDADGRWECEWAGATWEGTWRLVPGANGISSLHVTERRVGDDGAWLEWKVTLTSPRAGTIDGSGGAFSLDTIMGPGL